MMPFYGKPVRGFCISRGIRKAAILCVKGSVQVNGWTKEEYALLVERIHELAEEKYRSFHQRLVPEVENLLGVRVPKLRMLAKEIAKEDWRGYLRAARDDSYEEIVLQGMVIGYAKADIEEILQYTAQFIPKINNWGVCDVFCGGLKAADKNRERVFSFIQPYLSSKQEFKVRFAVVLLLSHYITDTYIDRILTLLDGICHQGYYVKMAVAWTVSVCFVKYPEKTMLYLHTNKLDDWTYNKSLQKIVESNRVTADTKNTVLAMKRSQSGKQGAAM